MYVYCKTPGTGDISYFVWPNSDSRGAARYLNVALTARALGKPLVFDYDPAVTAAYGVAYESFLPDKNLGQAGVSKRSAFVVDKAGVIQYSEAHDNPGTMPDIIAIKACLAALK